MTELSAAATVAGKAWTCPFCPLACDHLGVGCGIGAEPLALQGGACARASRALAQFASGPPEASAQVDGQPCELSTAVTAAARLLAASRQALFAGLGTDVAGARALYPLACATGASCDAAAGEALIHGLRALQDRGQFTTTLAEVRTRADLIVFVGGLPTDLAPLIGLRCGIGEPQVARRQVVVLGPAPGDDATLADWAAAGGVSVDSVPLSGDLFDTLALLATLVLAPGARPPANRLPMVVLGHPALAAVVGARGRLPTVFIPVSAPGIGSAGHVFRTDGTVLMPLDAVYRDRLPALPDVLGRITAELRALREGVPS